jgi:hypothetical protein
MRAATSVRRAYSASAKEGSGLAGPSWGGVDADIFGSGAVVSLLAVERARDSTGQWGERRQNRETALLCAVLVWAWSVAPSSTGGLTYLGGKNERGPLRDHPDKKR